MRTHRVLLLNIPRVIPRRRTDSAVRSLRHRLRAIGACGGVLGLNANLLINQRRAADGLAVIGIAQNPESEIGPCGVTSFAPAQQPPSPFAVVNSR